jgi:hypothetical protein
LKKKEEEEEEEEQQQQLKRARMGRRHLALKFNFLLLKN